MNKEERIEKDGLELEPIEFYRPQDMWGEFSNFSKHGIVLPHPFTGEQTSYATGEHRYQAMKADTALGHDFVNRASSPTVAKHRGSHAIFLKYEFNLRNGWGSSKNDLCWYVMLEVVTAKAFQHGSIRHKLSNTTPYAIWEDSPVDDIWGIRYRNDYRGKNLLGEAWVYVRNIINSGGL